MRIDFSLVGYAQFKSIRQNISIIVKSGQGIFKLTTDRRVCFVNHDLKSVYQLYPEVENPVTLSDEELEKQISYSLNSANVTIINSREEQMILIGNQYPSLLSIHSFQKSKQLKRLTDGPLLCGI